MKMCKPGVREQDIFGTIEGIALCKRSRNFFPDNPERQRTNTSQSFSWEYPAKRPDDGN